MIQLTGLRFGRLTVLRQSAVSANGAVWVCKCDCGNEAEAKGTRLRAGAKVSCGCAKAESVKNLVPGNRTHGMSRHPLDDVFDNMVRRCEVPGTRRYERYGGRGIGICAEWRNSRGAFFAWAMAGWRKGLTIDRIDNDGHYEPNNCRWATSTEQQNNTSRNHRITHAGLTLTVAQWECKLGRRRGALQQRLDRGWDPHVAIETGRVRG